MIGATLKRPSAVIPPAMSLAALARVVAATLIRLQRNGDDFSHLSVSPVGPLNIRRVPAP